MSERVGILDWGIGGVGLLRALRQRSRVPVMYLSDCGHTPYGKLPAAALSARVSKLLAWMVQRGASSVVVACNAASSVLDEAESSARIGVPVLGMVGPAVVLCETLNPRKLGVIGGSRTIRSGVYGARLRRGGREVVQRIAQPLSAHVEAGTTRTRRCAADLDRILDPLRAMDAVLLACTHYPAMADAIAERLPGVPLLDPAERVVEQLLATLPLPTRGVADLLFTSGDPRMTETAALRAWGMNLRNCRAQRFP
jgi:glutamate racemase